MEGHIRLEVLRALYNRPLTSQAIIAAIEEALLEENMTPQIARELAGIAISQVTQMRGQHETQRGAGVFRPTP